MNMNNPQMQECIQSCLECYQMCQQTAAQHCLEAGGAHVEAEHMRLMMACAEMCRTAAHIVMTGVAQHAVVCAACAELCAACADSCDSVGDMDECVQACRDCAQSCSTMAGDAAAMLHGRSGTQPNQGQLAM